MNTLTQENYKQGFLVDDDLMGGVTQNPEQQDSFVAFVLQHTSGQYLGYHAFSNLDEALRAINRIERPWTYERFGGCGSGNCGAEGGCKAGACRQKKCSTENCETS